MAKRNIAARRKLADLYVKGAEVRFNQEGARRGPFEEPLGEDEVAVWVQPPDPLQREQALREAQAVRARTVLRAKNDPNSEERLNAQVFVSEMSNETLIDYILTLDSEERQREAMRDVLSKKEWEDFTDLQDAMRQFEEAGSPEDDPEFAPLIKRDMEFGDQVNKRFLELTEAAREVTERMPREKLEKRAIDRRVDMLASQSFMKAYERNMLFYACRDPEDRTELFFDKVDELISSHDQVYQELSDTLAAYIQDGAQAKNSSRAEPGSDSSVPPSEPGTTESSGPEEQSA